MTEVVEYTASPTGDPVKDKIIAGRKKVIILVNDFMNALNNLNLSEEAMSHIGIVLSICTDLQGNRTSIHDGIIFGNTEYIDTALKNLSNTIKNVNDYMDMRDENVKLTLVNNMSINVN